MLDLLGAPNPVFETPPHEDMAVRQDVALDQFVRLVFAIVIEVNPLRDQVTLFDADRVPSVIDVPNPFCEQVFNLTTFRQV